MYWNTYCTYQYMHSHLNGYWILNAFTFLVPRVQAYHFGRKMDEPSHFHFNENRWKESAPAQTLFPELDLIPLWFCHFVTTQRFANGFARERRESDWGVSSTHVYILLFSSNADMQIYTCSPSPSTQGQLSTSMIWYANVGCHAWT